MKLKNIKNILIRKKNNRNIEFKGSLAVIYFVPKSNPVKFKNWQDGFTRAIELLDEDFKITMFNIEIYRPSVEELNRFDFVIVKSCWDWVVDEYIRSLKKLRVPRGIMVSCSKLPSKKSSMKFYDIIWCETFWYKNMLQNGFNLVHAFGVNSKDFYFESEEKTIDVLGIGKLTSYKRFEKFMELPQKKKVIVGDFDAKDSEKLRKQFEKSGIIVLDYRSQSSLRNLINQSNLVYIPSVLNGGGERAVLEARLCGVPVKVEKDNPKLTELLKGPIWDEYYYANQLRTSIENFFKISDKVYSSNRIYSNPKLMVGRHSFHNGNFSVKGDENVSIGAFCSFGKNVSIITSNHDTNYLCTQGYLYRRYYSTKHPGEVKDPPSSERTKGAVSIGSDVWIGDNVTILSGVKIGNGASIATGTIVVKDVNDFEVHGGIPNKFLKKRFSDRIISEIKNLKWWNWSDKRIKTNENFFKLNLNETLDDDIFNNIV